MPVVPASRIRSAAALPAGVSWMSWARRSSGSGTRSAYAGLLEPLHLPGDVRGLHPQPVGQLAGAHRPGLGELPQDHHGGTVQRHGGHDPDPVVAPGPGDQVGDPGDLPQDLGGIRGIRGIRGDRGGGGFWLSSGHVSHLTLLT